MLAQKSGPRWDGQDWPARGGELDVPDDEGMALCGQGDAVPVVTGDVETPEDTLAVPVEARADEPGEPDEPPALAVRPIVNSPKAAWVDYAVALGADRAGAEGSTKTDLIAWVKDREG
jgi:hypothetical protein